MANFVESVSIAYTVGYGLLVVAVILAALYLIYLIYKLVRKGLGIGSEAYDAFIAPGGQIEDQIVNMFTSHNDEGQVEAKDVKPKSVDAVDWIFMNHEDPT
jgi:hypothetical protein